MSTISHDAPGPHRVPISTKLRIPALTKIPSAVFIAVFAWLATIVVAKRGFGPEK